MLEHPIFPEFFAILSNFIQNTMHSLAFLLEHFYFSQNHYPQVDFTEIKMPHVFDTISGLRRPSCALENFHPFDASYHPYEFVDRFRQHHVYMER